jgi:hypothetical protein
MAAAIVGIGVLVAQDLIPFLRRQTSAESPISKTLR